MWRFAIWRKSVRADAGCMCKTAFGILSFGTPREGQACVDRNAGVFPGISGTIDLEEH